MAKAKKISLKPSGNDENFFLSPNGAHEPADNLFSGEGQLSCDVYQDNKNVIVKSTIAGVDPKDLDISVSNDLLTIRGFRESEDKVAEENYYCRECYWGTFSRTIVLPQEVDHEKIQATIKNGVLTVILPKRYKSTSIEVKQLDD